MTRTLKDTLAVHISEGVWSRFYLFSDGSMEIASFSLGDYTSLYIPEEHARGIALFLLPNYFPVKADNGALGVVLGAAARLLNYITRQATIDFDNDSEVAYAEKLREAIEVFDKGENNE